MNINFVKFKVFHKKSYSSEYNILDIEGIRTDGLFITRDEKYPKRTELINFVEEIKDGDEFYEYDPEIIKEKDKIKKEEDTYRNMIKAKERQLTKKLKKLDLTPLKKYVDAFSKIETK